VRLRDFSKDLLALERLEAQNDYSPQIAELRARIGNARLLRHWRQFPEAYEAVRQHQVFNEVSDGWWGSAEGIAAFDSACRNRFTRLPTSHGEAWNRIAVTIIGHQRVQFPVGQGGFHAGGLTWLANSTSLFDDWAKRQHISNADFLYIYDCGSAPEACAMREVETLLKRCRGKRLDLLFLSHFDADHVSGIPQLIGEGALKVDTIVMPYVDDLEKVIGFARSAAATVGGNPFLAELVVDTIGTLRQLGARRILFIDHGEGSGPDGDDAAPPSGGEGGEFKWKIGGSGDNPPQVSSIENDVYVVREGSIDVLGRADAGLAWKFLPYVQHADEETREIFAAIAETLFDWPAEEFVLRIGDPDVRRELVRDHWKVLGKAYLHAFGNKNATSMSLYSGPADPRRAGATVIKPELAPKDFAKVGWLGTGDAPLRTHAKIDAFEDFYDSYLAAVSTFMLPHHGSIENSRHDRLISDADLYVAAANPSRDSWKHPSPHLKKAVTDGGKHFWQVNGEQRSRLEEVMVLFAF
jgi:hypothetical protein